MKKMVWVTGGNYIQSPDTEKNQNKKRGLYGKKDCIFRY